MSLLAISYIANESIFISSLFVFLFIILWSATYCCAKLKITFGHLRNRITPHATNNHYYTYTCLIFWDPLATKGRDEIAVCFLMSFTHMFIWVLLSQLYCQSAPGSEVRGLVNGSCSSCR